MISFPALLPVFTLCMAISPSYGFSMVMMARRGKGSLQRSLDDTRGKKTREQRITGVTLPAEGRLIGWEFGEGVRVTCCQVNGRYYAVQGECPRCAFDLWKGDLIANDPAFDELPRVACPTCATTYSMRTGKYGPPLKRKGLQAFVSGLTKSATTNDAKKDARVFLITVDEDGHVFCR